MPAEYVQIAGELLHRAGQLLVIARRQSGKCDCVEGRKHRVRAGEIAGLRIAAVLALPVHAKAVVRLLVRGGEGRRVGCGERIVPDRGGDLIRWRVADGIDLSRQQAVSVAIHIGAAEQRLHRDDLGVQDNRIHRPGDRHRQFGRDRQPCRTVPEVRVGGERTEQDIGLEGLTLGDEDRPRGDPLLLRRTEVQDFLGPQVGGEQGVARGQARQRVEVGKHGFLSGHLALDPSYEVGLRGRAVHGEGWGRCRQRGKRRGDQEDARHPAWGPLTQRGGEIEPRPAAGGNIPLIGERHVARPGRCKCGRGPRALRLCAGIVVIPLNPAAARRTRGAHSRLDSAPMQRISPRTVPAWRARRASSTRPAGLPAGKTCFPQGTRIPTAQTGRPARPPRNGTQPTHGTIRHRRPHRPACPDAGPFQRRGLRLPPR